MKALRVVNALLLVLILAGAGWFAYLVLAGDPALSIGRRVEQNLLWAIALAPLLILRFGTFLLGALLSGKAKPAGPGDFDSTTAAPTNADGSSFGSMGND